MPRTTRILYDSIIQKPDYVDTLTTNVDNANSPEGYRFGNAVNERWGSSFHTTTSHGTYVSIRAEPSTSFDNAGDFSDMGFAVFNHNLYAAGGVDAHIGIYSSTNGTAWTAVMDVEVPSSDPDLMVFSTNVDFDGDLWYEIRFYFDASGAVGPSVTFEVGEVFLGKAVELSAQLSPRRPMDGQRRWPALAAENPTGGRSVQGRGYRELPFEWKTGKLSEANWKVMLDILDAQDGGVHPFVMYSHRENYWTNAASIFGTEDPDGTPISLYGGPPWWVRLDGDSVGESEVNLDRYRLSIPLLRVLNKGAY